MPGTWDWVQSNLSPSRRLDPGSAEDNVRAGSLYLAQLLRETSGDPAMAAAGLLPGPVLGAPRSGCSPRRAATSPTCSRCARASAAERRAGQAGAATAARLAAARAAPSARAGVTSSARNVAGVRARGAGDLLGRAGATTSPPSSPPSGPMSMIRSAVLMTSRLCSMTTTRVARVDEPVQHLEQPLDVGEVQAGRRLVEDVERAPGRDLRQLGRELDALRLAARQRRRRLAEADVAEADVVERLQPPADLRDVLEELDAPPRPACRARRRSSCP